jgi:cobalt/nickel transport system ATP-binding protein
MAFGTKPAHAKPGSITVGIVDTLDREALAAWRGEHPGSAIGAMGTRAKELAAAQENLTLEFTYGVIDKCILRALRGHDSLILTTGSMADRVATRIEMYCQESGNSITVIFLQAGRRKDPDEEGVS